MYYELSNEDFSLKPKHTGSNKIDINSVVVDGLYFPFTIPISDYCIFLHLLRLLM